MQELGMGSGVDPFATQSYPLADLGAAGAEAVLPPGSTLAATRLGLCSGGAISAVELAAGLR
jgi:hypothetical protein